jgi:hypothetical protein
VGRLPDLEIRVGDSITQDLVEWIDHLRAIINNGKYSLYVTDTIPTGTGNNGDALIYSSGGTMRLYAYFGNSWHYITFTT